MPLDPVGVPRRSPIYRKQRGMGAKFSKSNNGAIAESLSDADEEMQQAQQLGLCDLSVLPRCGFKGPGTIEWLMGQDVPIPATPNLATTTHAGCLAARLAPNECLLLADLAGQSTLCDDLIASWAADTQPPVEPRGFPVPRQDSHAWFAVSGKLAVEVFARLCAVDLRPAKFDNHSIAQTITARVTTIILRHDIADTLTYYVLADTTSAEYLWDCLDEASKGLAGAVIGVTGLRLLSSRSR